jgi:hypothetical protein
VVIEEEYLMIENSCKIYSNQYVGFVRVKSAMSITKNLHKWQRGYSGDGFLSRCIFYPTRLGSAMVRVFIWDQTKPN